MGLSLKADKPRERKKPEKVDKQRKGLIMGEETDISFRRGKKNKFVRRF
jgi:hypothetical protein